MSDIPDASELAVLLQGCVDLIEGWAYGPLFEKAGVRWPDGRCQAPALVAAKNALSRIPVLK